MPTLLRRLPYVFDGLREDRPVLLRTNGVDYHPSNHQIVIFIRICHHKALNWKTPHGSYTKLAIPAILDPGCTENVVIYESHLSDQWMEDRSPKDRDMAFPYNRAKRVKARDNPKEEVSRRGAKVWLFHNRPGSVAYDYSRDPLELLTPDGIVVRPGTAPERYRFPLIGLKALTDHGLRLVVSGRHGNACLWKPCRILPWNWPLLPWPWFGRPLIRDNP